MKRRHWNLKKNRCEDHHLFIGVIFCTKICDQKAQKPPGGEFLRIILMLKNFRFLATPLKEKIKVFVFIPKTSSEYLKTFIYLYSDVYSVHELIGTKIIKWGTRIWKTVKLVCRVLEPVFLEWEKNQEVRCKKPFG